MLADCGEVSLEPAAIRRFVDDTPDAALALPAWDDPGMFHGSLERGIAWLMAYNAINYCYWPDVGTRWHTRVAGREVGVDDEALGIMVAFADALDRGVPLDDGRWLSGLSLATLRDLLAPAPGAGDLPLLELRLAGLHELGLAWQTWGGAGELVERARGSAVGLVEVLVTACPSWEDARPWGMQTLLFRKRAQLCVAMIHGWSAGETGLSGIDALTAFADYRLPQILRGAGILRVSPELEARIDEGDHIPAGDPAEIALRAATVVAAERLREAFAARRAGVDAIVVDHVLWRAAVARQAELPPFHRTRTTDY